MKAQAYARHARSAAVPAASSGGVSPREATPGGTPGKLAGEDACATLVRVGLALLYVLLLLCAPATPLFAQQPAVDPAGEDRVRFRAVDIFIDSTNAPLAAYQLEFAVTNGVAKIVGIEGGEHPAFHEAPFYDPKAMQRERVILAAFSTESPDHLPTGKTRVATIHLQISGDVAPAFEIKLTTAAGSTGNKIAASVRVEERKPQ